MAETNDIQETTPQVQRNSRLGLIAFILSLVPFVMFCALVFLYVLLVNVDTLDPIIGDAGNLGYPFAYLVSIAAFCPSILGVLAALTAVVLGAISLVRKDSRKGFAIAGIGIGILTGVVMCALTLLLTVISRT